MTAVATDTGSVTAVRAAAYTIPTDAPESDGTLAWTQRTLVVVEVDGAGHRGLGYSYGDAAVAGIAAGALARAVEGVDVLDTGRAHAAADAALRNIGRAGAGAMALSALDVALHDLKARVLGVPLWRMLGAVRDRVPAYGSGGFTSYDDARLAGQLAAWVDDGIPRVKVKVGRRPDRDERRLDVARAAVGDDVELMVDANGAYGRREAVLWAARYAARGVTWLEEPVSSDDVPGMAQVRDRAPGGIEIAAGEHVWREPDALGLLDAVDVLQVDVTRCGGITTALRIDALARARSMPTSIHCAPAIGAHAGAAMPTLRHVEYFHDHVRIERMLFDGVAPLGAGGVLVPPANRPGLGLELKRADAERFRA